MRCLTILSPKPQTIEEGRETANTSESSTCDELRGKKNKARWRLYPAPIICVKLKVLSKEYIFALGVLRFDTERELSTFCTPCNIWTRKERRGSLWTKPFGYRALLCIFNLFTSKRWSCCRGEEVRRFFSLQGTSDKHFTYTRNCLAKLTLAWTVQIHSR